MTFDMVFLFQTSSPNYLKSRPIKFMKTLSEKFEIGEELWPKVYMLSSKCAIGTRIRVFQYKILNNILYLNKHLYKIKVVESPLCSLCQKENETFEHLSVDCTFRKTMDRYKTVFEPPFSTT